MNTKRILIIDDETAVTRTIKVNLERSGQYTVRTENNAANALAAATEFKPDLIILDVMMPGMDGGEVAAQIKADTFLKEVPIVFLTAIVSKAEAGKGQIVRGGEKFIAKPVNVSDLIKCIEENLAGSEDKK